MKKFVSLLSVLMLLNVHFALSDGVPPTSNNGVSSAQNLVRAAVVQLDASDAGDFAKMAKFAMKAKRDGAELIIFPEGSLLGWLNPAVFTQAPPIPGQATTELQNIAKTAQIWIASGLAEQGVQASNGVHYAYDSAVLINPHGDIILHQRKNNVLKNAFVAEKCPKSVLNKTGGCNYKQGPLSDIKVAQTPFGKTTLLVCADAYTASTSGQESPVLKKVKNLKPNFVIVTWGVGAQSEAQCGQKWFNATDYASDAAKVIETATVIGANAVGERPYGRFRPAVYCGYSGFTFPSGAVGGVVSNAKAGISYFDIPTPAQ